MFAKSRIWGCAGLLVGLVGCAMCGQGYKQALSGEERTGHPSEISPCAQPSDTGNYVGYQVGGGAACAYHGEPPYVDDGTWGWDYKGCLLPSRIILDWFHGTRDQGGYGAYKTDGPRPVEEFEHRND
jgi:hypothetical protein